MTGKTIKERILSSFSAVAFEYNGKKCGIDPFSENEFCLWCGDKDITVHSIDAVTETAFFDGKSLEEIANQIDIYEW